MFIERSGLIIFSIGNVQKIINFDLTFTMHTVLQVNFLLDAVVANNSNQF